MPKKGVLTFGIRIDMAIEMFIQAFVALLHHHHQQIDHISGMVGFVRTFPELLDNLEKGGVYSGLPGLSDNFMTQ